MCQNSSGLLGKPTEFFLGHLNCGATSVPTLASDLHRLHQRVLDSGKCLCHTLAAADYRSWHDRCSAYRGRPSSLTAHTACRGIACYSDRMDRHHRDDPSRSNPAMARRTSWCFAHHSALGSYRHHHGETTAPAKTKTTARAARLLDSFVATPKPSSLHPAHWFECSAVSGRGGGSSSPCGSLLADPIGTAGSRLGPRWLRCRPGRYVLGTNRFGLGHGN